MKAVLGNRSPRLPGLILSSGAGVGGHALRSGRTMYTPEYASSAVDQDLVSVAADDEGIVSLLAVPISFAGVVRAMLHVGWRHSSPVDHGVAEALSRVATYAGAAFAVAADRVRGEEAARMERMSWCVVQEYGKGNYQLVTPASAKVTLKQTNQKELRG